MRWSLILSRYNFRIIHVPGTKNERADALSRRDQDIPTHDEDQHLTDRCIQLLKPRVLVANNEIRESSDNNNVESFTNDQIHGEMPDELKE